MEIPEKIYIQPNAHDGWFEGNKPNDNFIEYVRKDALIKKAIGYIDGVIEFLNEYGHQLKKERIIEDFKKCMED